MQLTEEKIFTNDNCIGCNLCIASCPCDEANVAVMESGGNKIYINPEKCITCGECVRQCPHNARDYIDDTERFFMDLKAGKRISLLVAPSVRTNFSRYKNLLGFLRKSGAANLFDVSYGADISTWAYLRHMTRNKSSGLISQPCPTIVNYIERYSPELLSKLAPVQSPVMCMAIYMRKRLQISGSYALLSPCIAKRDEIMDDKNGRLIEYNITFKKLKEYLEANHLDYSSDTPSEFDNQQHGLGAVYPMPGGLKTNIEQYIKDQWIFQVEGQPHACHFLDEYARSASDSYSPFLVDILSCQHGCNAGTGAVRDEGESYAMSRRLYQAQTQAKSSTRKAIPGPDFKKLDRELDLEDYRRSYTNKTTLETPVSSTALDNAYHKLHKFREKDRRVDCRSCGYTTCAKMAEAVAKNINHPDNCVEFIKSRLAEEGKKMEAIAQQRDQQAQELASSCEIIFHAIDESAHETERTLIDVQGIADRIGTMNDISQRLTAYVKSLRDEIDKYIHMGDEIVNLSKQTNLLAINASVEAMRVGSHGRGFAVVAEKIRDLSDQSEQSAQDALENNEVISPLLAQVQNVSDEVLDESRLIADNSEKILEAVSHLTAIMENIAASATQIEHSQQITTSL